MKLLFVGLEPSKAFQSTVISHGFSCVCLSEFFPEKNKQKCEMVICRIPSIDKIPLLSLVKKRCQDSWVVAVVPAKKLDQPEFYSLLLENESKDGVWTEENWESLFWFSYQQMLEGRNKTQQLKLLRKEVAQFQEKTIELSQSSDRLLDKFKKDVDLAENIQRVLRPRFSPHIPGVSLSVKYIPSVGVGGDYYDIFEFGDKKRFGFLLADSKSHGMAAALLTVLLKLRLEEMKDRFPDSKSFITFVNQEIRAVYNKNSASMSLFYGILDRASLDFHYTSAGNIHPIVWREGKPQSISQRSNPEVGTVDCCEYHENRVSLQPGDLMILFTDGLEMPLKKGKMNAEQRIKELLTVKEQTPDPLRMQNELMGIVDAYTSKKKLRDDLTLIQLAVDEKAMYVAKAEGDQSR